MHGQNLLAKGWIKKISKNNLLRLPTVSSTTPKFSFCMSLHELAWTCNHEFPLGMPEGDENWTTGKCETFRPDFFTWDLYILDATWFFAKNFTKLLCAAKNDAQNSCQKGICF